MATAAVKEKRAAEKAKQKQADNDKVVLAQAIKDHATRLGRGFAKADDSRLEYEQWKQADVGNRKDEILEAVDLLCRGAEGVEPMHTVLPVQAQYIELFQKAAWVAKGHKGEPITSMAAAKTQEDKEIAWPTLGIMGGYLKSVFLAGNIATQKALAYSAAEMVGIVAPIDAKSSDTWDAWTYLHQSPAWKDLTARATQIRRAAVAASLITAKQGPATRQQLGTKRKASNSKKAELFAAVEFNADNAADGRKLVYAALKAFTSQGVGEQRSALAKLTDAYISEVNRLLEPVLRVPAAPNTTATVGILTAPSYGTSSVPARETPVPQPVTQEDRVTERTKAEHAEEQKRGSFNRAVVAAEAMERGLLPVDELANKAAGKGRRKPGKPIRDAA